MTVTVTTEAQVTTVALSGKMNLTQSPYVREQLLRAVGKNRLIVVDMKNVLSVDGAIVANLIEALDLVQRAGGRLVLRDVSRSVQQVLEISRLNGVFEIVRTGKDS